MGIVRRISKFDWFPYLMVAPAFLLVFTLTLYPLIQGFRLSFYNWTLIAPRKPFIGFANYSNLLGDTIFWEAVVNTLQFTVLSVGLSTLLGLGVSLLLHKALWGRGVFRAVTLIPWVTPSVVIGLTWVWIFSKDFSPINGLLMHFRLITEPISFLGNTSTTFLGLTPPFWSVLFVRVWTSYTFKAIMFLATLQSIPEELYEAAAIDGATSWQQFRFVTIPFLTSVIISTSILSTIWNLSHFDYNFLLTKGGPFGLTNVLGVFIYQTAFSDFRLGYASAAGVLILLMASILGILYLMFISREQKNNALG